MANRGHGGAAPLGTSTRRTASARRHAFFQKSNSRFTHVMGGKYEAPHGRLFRDRRYRSGVKAAVLGLQVPIHDRGLTG
ncbi:hypothetical protein M378DRAFT_160727 [Amanita muscaria Koide BX008]|uniref:Uncharacterized protein n=1 Tax=Amanita muscaria (strain Koide BX008) TaxID=946122 RepID=A0A0C2TIA0_AMAMK|nr:hypothetical protein M378DRAFT_160727 [Amanita muscaria Koide BX008]